MTIEILRPIAPGDECNVPNETGCSACPNHYDCVYEEVADEDTTKVYTTLLAWREDLYNIANHSVGSGTINHITVYVRCKSVGAPNRSGLLIECKSTTVHQSAGIQPGTSYGDESYQWATNPDTGEAWTWDEIDALQIGFNLRSSQTTGGETHVTQAWLAVDYTAVVTHEWEGSDGIALTDTLIKTPMKVLVDGFQFSDVTIKEFYKTLTDGIAFTDTLIGYKIMIKILTDGIAIGEALIKTTSKVVSDGIAFTDTLWKVWTHGVLRILNAVRNLPSVREDGTKR